MRHFWWVVNVSVAGSHAKCGEQQRYFFHGNNLAAKVGSWMQKVVARTKAMPPLFALPS